MKVLIPFIPVGTINFLRLVSWSTALPLVSLTSANPTPALDPVKYDTDRTSAKFFPWFMFTSNKYNLYSPSAVPGVLSSYTTDLTLAVPTMLPVNEGPEAVTCVAEFVDGTVSAEPAGHVDILLPAVSNNLTSAAVLKSKLPRYSLTTI